MKFIGPSLLGSMKIRIKNLRLKTILGVNARERESPQEVAVHVELEFDGERAAATDDIDETVDYGTLTERIVREVEASRYHLLEALAGHILKIVLEDERVIRASVEVDKPQALSQADSVSVFCSYGRPART